MHKEKEAYFIERYGMDISTYIEKVSKYNTLFELYFDKANEMMVERKIDKEYLLEKYGSFVQNEEAAFLAYAQHGYNEILFSINEYNYRVLDEADLLFIKESILYPFANQIEYLMLGLNKKVDLSEIHDLKDTIPYVLGRFSVENDQLIGGMMPEVEDELEEIIREMLRQEVESFDAKEYMLAVKKYREITNTITEKEAEIIEVICGNYSVDMKNVLLQKYLEYVDSLHEDVNGDFSIVSRIGAILEECIDRFPAWSEVSEEEILSFEDKVTFNYILILFHKYRLSMESRWEEKLLEAMVQYFRKQFNGSELKSEVDLEKVLIPTEKATAEDIELMRCYNNIYAYYSYHKNYFDNKKYEEVFDNANIEKTDDRNYQMIEEMLEEQTMIQMQIEKQQTLFAHAKQEEKDSIRQQILEAQAELERIEKTIEAKYAREILASSMDVVFLLKEYISIKLNANPSNDELNRIKNAVRFLEADIKNTIYSNAYILDFYREDRERYNTGRISYKELQYKETEDETKMLELLYELDEKEQRISELDNVNKKNMLIKAYYKYCIEALKNEDVTSIMSKRNELLTDCDLLLREDEEEIEAVGNIISDLVIKNISEDTTASDVNTELEAELGNAKKVLPESCYKTLYTAEYLYHFYVKNEEAKELMDYSCISALYYQALEGAYNKLIYSGYIEWIGKKGVSKELFRYRNTNKRTGSNDIAYGYFPETRWGKDCFSKYWAKDSETNKIKENCMYADFIYLMESANENSPEVTHFCEYLRELWGADWNHEKMKVFCEGLDMARPRRNAASHGGTVITKKGAETDKKIVLLEKRTTGLKDLIVKLCEFFI